MPVILVIMDGVGFEIAVSQCGFLEGSVEQGHAKRWKMQSCLPTISAALYETIHTGLAPAEHGITGNESLRPSQADNVFSLLRTAGKTSAAVAHSFFYTLYCGEVFNPLLHCEINDPDLPIAYGRFYSMDGASGFNPCAPAEIDLCAQATILMREHKPDYMLLHSSSADSLGHVYGGDSAEYRKQAWAIDNALARAVPMWLEAGYDIFVTADHGMNADGHHGGNEAVLREIPFYYFGKEGGPEKDAVLDQRSIAPSILSSLSIAVPEEMKFAPLF